MEQLKNFWTYVSTPGSQMPVKDTIIFLVIVFAIIVLMPQFVQWRAYRKENPMSSDQKKKTTSGNKSAAAKTSMNNVSANPSAAKKASRKVSSSKSNRKDTNKYR